MPGKFEKRSARLLALFLALIMIGSAIAIAFRGGSPSNQTELRPVKYHFRSFKEWLKCLPPTGHIIYISEKNCTNDTMMEYLQKAMSNNIISGVFDPVTFTTPIERILVALYPKGLLYLFDINQSKMNVSGEKINVNGIDMWIKNVEIYGRYYTIGVTPEVSPAIIGTAPEVKKSIEVLTGNGTSMYSLVGPYLRNVTGSFNTILMLYGKEAENILVSNNTPYGDFYFSGIRMNGSRFEKVVVIHFITTGGFVMSNNTSKEFSYYWVNNYPTKNGTVSIAIMDSTNFTKILNAEPQMRIIEIHLGKLVTHRKS